MGLSRKEIERIFHEARRTAVSERRALLDRRCGNDPQARLEVESLLRHEGQPTERVAAFVPPIAAAWAAASRDGEPEVLGPYRIERRLGEGGMGSVCLATDSRLDRRVAIKFIRGAVAHTPDAKARFLREAQSAAALAHPNIAQVYDYGEAEGRPWLVMEYIEGLPLRAHIQSGAVSESQFMDYAAQLASALEHAHARRIIHGDIKPENIMVTAEGRLKLVDFGLARIMDEDSTREEAPEGVVFATPAYAAPELLSGASISTRMDVYSFGAVLQELVQGPPGSTDERPLAPEPTGAMYRGIHDLIERCLSRDPADRYPNGGAVAAALRTIRTNGLVAAGVSPLPMVAILDFQKIGASREIEWLGAGIAESLWADLARIKELQVAHRGRIHQRLDLAGQAHHDATAVAELARELGIDWIVTGAFQQAEDRIRVSATVVEVATGEITAIERLDGRSQDLFGLQDCLAKALKDHLRLRLGGRAEDTGTVSKAPSLAAYEHYVRGRQQMYQMRETSLADAIQQLQQAVALDSGYALAFSALGTAHALQFLRTSNPADIAQASEYLEHATKLDPELGEPYPWLCNVRIRLNDPIGSMAAGAKGIQLQPDLPEAHYFSGGVHYMLAERPDTDPNRGLQSLINAVQIQPKFHPAWIVGGALSIYLGQYQNAIDLLEEAIRLEQEPDLLYRFEGARTMLGLVHFRRGDATKSVQYYVEALQRLSRSDHVYRDTFRILSACGIGAIELRAGNPDAAAAHYRQAWQIIQEKPRIVGSARLQIRAGAGLAASYGAANERQRGQELLTELHGLLEPAAGQYATLTLECSLGQLYLDVAVAERANGHIEQAARLVERACEARWRDRGWLSADPLLRGLYAGPEV